MKHRNGFVSNSSSSSFIIIGLDDRDDLVYNYVINKYEADVLRVMQELASDKGCDIEDINISTAIQEMIYEEFNFGEVTIQYFEEVLYIGLDVSVLEELNLPQAREKLANILKNPKVGIKDIDLIVESSYG